MRLHKQVFLEVYYGKKAGNERSLAQAVPPYRTAKLEAESDMSHQTKVLASAFLQIILTDDIKGDEGVYSLKQYDLSLAIFNIRIIEQPAMVIKLLDHLLHTKHIFNFFTGIILMSTAPYGMGSLLQMKRLKPRGVKIKWRSLQNLGAEPCISD